MATTKLVDEYGTEVRFEALNDPYIYVSTKGALDTSTGVLMNVDHQDDTYIYSFDPSDIYVVAEEEAPVPVAPLVLAFRGILTGRTYCHDCAFEMQLRSPRVRELLAEEDEAYAERVYHSSAVELVLLMGEEALVVPVTRLRSLPDASCSACGMEL